MSGFIKGADRNQATLFPESLDDYVAEESAVRASTQASNISDVHSVIALPMGR